MASTSTSASKAPGVNIIDAFKSATAEDLESLQDQISDVEKQLEGLYAIEKALNIRINGKPAWKGKGKGGKSASSAAPPQGVTDSALLAKRQKVAAYLKANGPKSTQKISEVTGISQRGPGCLSVVLACDQFHTNPDGMVSLTGKAGDHDED